MDKWSTADVNCALINIGCNVGLFFMNKETILQKKKLPFNILMLMIVFISWYRICVIMLVEEKLSVLIMTIIEMLTAGLNFFAMLIYYFVIMSVIFMGIFANSHGEIYSTMVMSVKKMFDYMMASYGWEERESTSMDILHTIFVIIHIYVACIFMLNYLIAILSDVFGRMQEQAMFEFNRNLY